MAKRVRPDKILLRKIKQKAGSRTKQLYFFSCIDGDNGETRWGTETYRSKSGARRLAIKYAQKHSNHKVYDFDGKLIFPKG